MESDGTSAEISPDEATGAIALIDGSRSWLASRVIAPGWYHPAFGLLAGGLIAEGEARSWALFAWSVVGYTIACGALAWVNQRRVRLQMSYWFLRTRLIFAAQILTLGLLAATACWLDLGHGVRGLFLAAGALAAVATVAFGRWTDRALRAHLRTA
jgi:hypothetical protein